MGRSIFIHSKFVGDIAEKSANHSCCVGQSILRISTSRSDDPPSKLCDSNNLYYILLASDGEDPHISGMREA